MSISADTVKKLREKTGAGMMDCKKALEEAGGDIAKAEKILKEQGLAAAAKRSGRATTEGRIFTLVKDSKACMLELSCETDFVAINKDFIALGNEIIAHALNKGLSEADAAVNEKLTDAISRIKENITVRRLKTVSLAADELAVDYMHGEGRIGVIVILKADKAEAFKNAAVKEFAFDTSLHIAAFNPMFLSAEKADPAYMKEQEEIFRKQVSGMDKPANVLDGIVKGKLNKHLAEVCLLNQPFVKDDKKALSAVMAEKGKEAGAVLSIKDFIYFRVGEELN
jgi:elongation factor Ts